MDGYGWMDDGWVEGWMGGKVAYERENGRADWNRQVVGRLGGWMGERDGLMRGGQGKGKIQREGKLGAGMAGMMSEWCRRRADGWKEGKIVAIFGSVTLLLCVVAWFGL